MDWDGGRKLLICVVLLGGWLPAYAQSEATPADVATEPAAAVADEVTTDTATTDSATEAEVPAPTGIVPGSELQSMTAPLVRMVLSLAAVLALVGVFAWLAKRFRGAQLQGGLIQIVGGLSLGPKDRVVLLRVGEEEILVGMSPSGMRQLHVMNKPSAQFSLDLADTERQG